MIVHSHAHHAKVHARTAAPQATDNIDHNIVGADGLTHDPYHDPDSLDFPQRSQAPKDDGLLHPSSEAMEHFDQECHSIRRYMFETPAENAARKAEEKEQQKQWEANHRAYEAAERANHPSWQDRVYI